ncbi:PaaI family thioesterase [Alkalimonas sp. MEB108]|uniref:PaaI family thioesterase n=1 Tax=Alkalimonas cellulosilytica TaxID=3058395 RepID=A0ABU7J8W5_9GAMM|nr:PaaI family thioesterase [Alkalimonas sp. MEB108]MEE2002907.1 PaaI family thioesterase [Alkalimonas sp. MEB108]
MMEVKGFIRCDQDSGFSAHIGPFYQKPQGEGFVRALQLGDIHLNPEGVVHGGVLLSFADYVIYRAIGDITGHQMKFATIQLNSQFLAAAKAGEVLLGEGRIVRQTRSVIFAEGRLFTERREIMAANGIWKVLGA